MIKNLRITVLVDNKSENEELLSEHGLSFWIEVDNKKILLDAGQSNILLQNAQKLNVDLSEADMLIISHGHYDHTGAIPDILKMNPDIKIYCHPGIFSPRYSRQSDGSMKIVGLNSDALFSLQSRIEKINWVNGPLFVTPDWGITGPIPRITEFEDTGGQFYLDPAGKRPDLIDDDLSLWFETSEGLVIVTGCCHSGLINTLNYCNKVCGSKKIRAVMGGFHLLHASQNRLEKTNSALKEISPQTLIPCHCTGENAIQFLNIDVSKQISIGKVGLVSEY